MPPTEVTAYEPAPRRPGALEVLGLPVHPVDASGILDFVTDTVATGRQAVVLHLNVFGANLAAEHPWLREFFGEAQLVFCDGDGIRWGLRILGSRPPPKVTYNEWVWQLAGRCADRGLGLYLLGARPGIAERAARALEARCPGLRISGTHHGYFDKQGPESAAVVAEINRLRPDVLLVCLGMPVQERWVRDNRAHLAVHVLLTGGAALDYAAGIVPVPPRWMKRLHLEWLFRYLLEPVRMFNRYIVGNPRFIGRVLAARLRRPADKDRGRPA